MSQPQKKRVLFIPSLKKGNGSGHFRRCVRFCTDSSIQAKVYVPERSDGTGYSLHELASLMPGFSKKLSVTNLGGDWDLYVLDQRATDRALLSSLPEHAAIVALDEGTPDSRMDYLIDLLPGAGKRRINLYDPLLGLDPRIPEKPQGSIPSDKVRILVTFGGEDASGLTEKVLRTLSDLRREGGGPLGGRPFDIHAVQGPLFGRDLSGYAADGVHIIKNPDNLSFLLHTYDIVITFFGLTSFECRKAGVPVFHVNPSRYHSRLSRASGFQVAGTGNISAPGLKSALEKGLAQACINETGNDKEADPSVSLPEFLSRLSLQPRECPGCGSRTRHCLERFPERSFYQCADCQLVYQVRAVPHGISYGTAYFFDEYTAQYGRTYLEDFDHIKEMGKTRLSVMEGITGHKNPVPRLLDIGCAYGPFVSAAKERGCDPVGVDISEEAAAYVTESLGIPALCSPFPLSEPAAEELGSFEIITMWYVIEHFEDLKPVLRQVSRLNTDQGLFCFSTPNYRGISSCTDRREFLSASPKDHWTILSPGSVRKLLAAYGYRVVRMRATGVHRQRFPFILRLLPSRLLTILAASFHLGDTFEVYARKMSPAARGKKEEQIST